ELLMSHHLPPLNSRWPWMATLAFLVLASAPAQAGFITFEAAGADPASITPARDAFRAAVGGGTVAGPNGSFGGLRREIQLGGVAGARGGPHPLRAHLRQLQRH